MPDQAKHTPGPWEYRHIGGVRGQHYVGAGAFKIISDTHATGTTNDGGQAEREANARLIAAAPDLLGACRALVCAAELHGADSEVFFMARNQALLAIAKAEGRDG